MVFLPCATIVFAATAAAWTSPIFAAFVVVVPPLNKPVICLLFKFAPPFKLLKPVTVCVPPTVLFPVTVLLPFTCKPVDVTVPANVGASTTLYL